MKLHAGLAATLEALPTHRRLAAEKDARRTLTKQTPMVPIGQDHAIMKLGNPNILQGRLRIHGQIEANLHWRTG